MDRRFLRVVSLFAVLCVITLTLAGCLEVPFLKPEATTEPSFAPLPSANETTAASPTDKTPETIVSGDLVISFLELGNKYTGDCTYIKAGDNDILIDAGSKVSSVATIDSFLKRYVTDGKLEYVIVTHAHEDHYAGFATAEDKDSLFDLYECEIIIDFSQITSGKSEQKMYNNYIRERDAEIAAGAAHYTAEQCMTDNKNIFDLGNGIELEILDSYYYYNRASSENDHSVCCMINQGDRHFLFTGDLEEKGEKKLVELNELPEVELYKAGHHGSKTSSSDELLEVIKPKMVAVCCCCGSPEYTDRNENQFPTQEFIDRVAKYTDKVYVTTLCVDYKKGEFVSMNGNITVVSSKDGIKLECSNNNTVLKETDWFKNNRTCPSEWKAA